MACSDLRISQEEARHFDELAWFVGVHRPEDLLDVPAEGLGAVSLSAIAFDIVAPEVPLEAVELPRFLQRGPGQICLKHMAAYVIDDSVFERGLGQPGVYEQTRDEATELGQGNGLVAESVVEQRAKGETTISALPRVGPEHFDEFQPRGQLLSNRGLGDPFRAVVSEDAGTVEDRAVDSSHRDSADIRRISPVPLSRAMDSKTWQPPPR